MNSEIRPNNILYSEDDRARPFEMYVKSKHYRYLQQAGVRIVALYLIYVLSKLLWAGHDHRINPLGPILLTLGIFGVLIISEDVEKSNIRAVTPFIIYDNGIKVRMSSLERLLGRKEFIPTEKIQEVRVSRHKTWYLDREKRKTIRWASAPISITIVFKNGRVYRSERKNNVEVLNMRNVMREHWDVPIIDDGDGIGIMVSK